MPSLVVAATLAPRPTGSIDQALWEVEAAQGPRTIRGHRRWHLPRPE
jgi:hypothetical protein